MDGPPSASPRRMVRTEIGSAAGSMLLTLALAERQKKKL